MHLPRVCVHLISIKIVYLEPFGTGKQVKRAHKRENKNQERKINPKNYFYLVSWVATLKNT